MEDYVPLRIDHTCSATASVQHQPNAKCRETAHAHAPRQNAAI
jgi:hypothetical protein